MLAPLLFAGLASVAYGRVPGSQILEINQKGFNVLDTVLPPSVANVTSIFLPPGISEEEAMSKPFHVYDDEFYKIIGDDPTLTLIAREESNPLFHEAVVWYPPTDEVFFAQNAGARAAGTGLERSNEIFKISLGQAAAVAAKDSGGSVDVVRVDANPQVINSNGATNYRGQLIFTGEGQGADVPPALYVMNPEEPHNTTILLNNFFGRQFNSLNDVSINPRNGEIYFTDVTYGYLQDFRPAPGFPNQVYRLNPDTGAVTVVADGFVNPNGLTFSPDGSVAYVTDTGAGNAFYGYKPTAPSAIYRYTVEEDGTWSSRKLFAFVTPGIPDGIHCDSEGNVYAGVGDGVHVWNPSGTLLGKIFVGETSANFNFAGDGRMVICAETRLYYATIKAEGGFVASEMPGCCSE